MSWAEVYLFATFTVAMVLYVAACLTTDALAADRRLAGARTMVVTWAVGAVLVYVIEVTR